jgi:hypothetical protein
MPVYDPNTPLSPGLASVKKLAVSVFSTGAALVTYLTTGDPTAAEAIAAIAAFVTTNVAVYEVRNES